MYLSGKETLTSIFNHKQTDRLCWSTLVDKKTLSVMPEDVKNMNPIEFYKFINCDILQFGNYGLENTDFMVKYPYKVITAEIENIEDIDHKGNLIRKQKSKWGELTTISKYGHPIKYPVETIGDLKVYKNIWLDSKFVFDDTGCKESYIRMDNEIGDHGIFAPITMESPVQRLLEEIVGTENFYYLYYDYPDEIEELLNIMHEVRKQEYSIIAEKMPHQVIIPVENTSTTYISPDFYRKYSVPQLRDYIDILHSHGKQCVLHMCGSIKDLLGDIKNTGLDGIHALTTAPVGNTNYEEALDALGEKLIIIGVMDPTIFHKQDITRKEIWDHLDRIYTPRIRKSNFILGLGADGVPTPLERFIYVKEWMEKNGGK